MDTLSEKHTLSELSQKYEYVYINPAGSGHELYFEIKEYMRYYNYERPHKALDKNTPAVKYNTKDSIKFLTKYSTIKSTLLV